MSRALRIATGVAVVAAAAALILLLPHWLSDAKAAEFARAGCFFIAILGLNLLIGYTGQISLGHGALMAVGAYTTAILTAEHGFRDLWTIPLAGLVAMAAGFVLGCRRCGCRGFISRWRRSRWGSRCPRCSGSSRV
jgi:branched-chain amino acid transport system permease protein